MASRSSAVPPTAVYFVKFPWIAAIAASLMCCGVAKCGSPAPKSTTSIPRLQLLSQSLLNQVGHQSFDRSTQLRDLAYKARTQIRVRLRRHHENRLQIWREFAVH